MNISVESLCCGLPSMWNWAIGKVESILVSEIKKTSIFFLTTVTNMSQIYFKLINPLNVNVAIVYKLVSWFACGVSKGFMRAPKAFIKPFDAPQANVFQNFYVTVFQNILRISYFLPEWCWCFAYTAWKVSN